MFMSFIKSSPAYASDKIDCPEKRLFIAILSQAIHDAFASHVPRLEKQAARNFLTRNSSDFRHICEMAGRDAAYVKERIRKQVLREKGWNERIRRRVLREKGWNVDLSLRTQPRRIRKHKQKHLTGNAYYAAKKREQRATA